MAEHPTEAGPDASGAVAGHQPRILTGLGCPRGRLRLIAGAAAPAPGQVRETELSLEPKGLVALLGFLEAGFGGGTDLEAPIARAVEQLDREGWERADLLVVTDGAFEVAPRTREVLAGAVAGRGLRVHGLVIGGEDAPALAALCGVVHRLADWSMVR